MTVITAEQISKIICSTLHIVMLDPTTKLPHSIGSGCMINYADNRILLTAAHVTNIRAATCIDLSEPSINNHNKLHSVGAMNYLQKYDIQDYKKQMSAFFNKSIRKEDKDFGLIDLSFAGLSEEIEIFQREIEFSQFLIKSQKKITINTNLDSEPNQKLEYAFYGRTRPCLEEHPTVNIFETAEIIQPGLKYAETQGHYYKFKLKKVIENNLDYKGTSGAPIFDSNGNLVSLVTHGYEGENFIYGIALSRIKNLFDSYIRSIGL